MVKDKKSFILSVADLKRDVESNFKKRVQTTMSDKVKKYLKEQYGNVSEGINILALKDMGEL